MTKKIVFLSGTRADFGKIKKIIGDLKKKKFDVNIFVTGMHLEKKFGYTVNEIIKSFPKTKIFKYKNLSSFNNFQDKVLAKTIYGFSKYINKIKPDLIIIHGDRVETLAAAIVGSLNNYLVAHIEGGERTGTIDEHIRHSVSKLSHLHFVSNLDAQKRLIKMGERKDRIFKFGSPDIDILKSKDLPNFFDVKKRYNIPFNEYIVLLYHPVTTESQFQIRNNSKEIFQVISKCKKNFVLIYPNNDPGHNTIIQNLHNKIRSKKNVKILRSMRFEFFLSLLKSSSLILGNSSSGIIEAPFYGIPTINLGTRQKNRSQVKTIFNSNFEHKSILKLINILDRKKFKKNMSWGTGDSSKKICNLLQKKYIWKTSVQKQIQY